MCFINTVWGNCDGKKHNYFFNAIGARTLYFCCHMNVCQNMMANNPLHSNIHAILCINVDWHVNVCML